MRNQKVYSILSQKNTYNSIEEILDLEFLNDMERSSRKNRSVMAWLATGIMVFYLLIATMGLLLLSNGNIRNIHFVQPASAHEFEFDGKSTQDLTIPLDIEPVTEAPDPVNLEPLS